MTIKPFAIQGADLTLGGVNLQAGTTGVVIPGVTQAASYRVDEVEDTGDQTTTFQSVPTIIDAVTFDDYVINQASIGRATYTCDLDDDGYIDDIEVTSTGLYLNTLAEADPLLAYTGAAPDPFDPFVQGDWTAIPFRPKMRAEGVETIGGSGTVVERSVTFPEGASGDTRGTIALTPDGTTYICTEDWADASIGLQGTFTATTDELYNVGQSGGSFNSAVLSIVDEPELYNILRYGSWTEGQLTINAGSTWGGAQNVVNTGWNDQAGTMSFLWIHRVEDPQEIPQGTSVTVVYTGSGTQPPIWKQLINLSQGGEGDGEISWRSDGDLTIETLRPAGYTDDCDLNLYAADDIFIEARGDDVGISAFNVVRINTDDGNHTWTFDQNGNLTIPGNILKTTEASIVVGELLVNVEVQTVDELVPPGGVWRLFINDGSYPTLGNTVQIGETVTTSWGTPITATIVDIQQDAGNWQIHVDQDITAGFNSYDTVTFSSVLKTWTFGTDGTVTFPTLTVPLEDNATPVGTGQVLQFSDSTQQAIIFGPVSTATNTSAERVIIQGAPGYVGTAGEGGDVYVWAGPGGSTNGQGGDIKVRAGEGIGSGEGGYLNFQAGDSTTGDGGYVNIESGYSNTQGQGGDITVWARRGGEIALRTDNGTTNLNWTFGADGNLTLPKASKVSEVTPATGPAPSIYPTPGISSIPNEDFVTVPPPAVNNYTIPGTDIVINMTFGANGPNYYGPTATIVNGGSGHTSDESLSIPYADMGIDLSGNWPWFVNTIASNLVLEAGTKDWTFAADGGITFPDATVQTTALVQGEQVFTLDTGAIDYAPTAVDFNLLFVTSAVGYSGTDPTSVTLPNGVPGQRLVIFNGYNLATLTVNPGPVGRDISSGVVAEFIYSGFDGLWMPLYGTNSPT